MNYLCGPTEEPCFPRSVLRTTAAWRVVDRSIDLNLRLKARVATVYKYHRDFYPWLGSCSADKCQPLGGRRIKREEAARRTVDIRDLGCQLRAPRAGERKVFLMPPAKPRRGAANAAVPAGAARLVFPVRVRDERYRTARVLRNLIEDDRSRIGASRYFHRRPLVLCKTKLLCNVMQLPKLLQIFRRKLVFNFLFVAAQGIGLSVVRGLKQ